MTDAELDDLCRRLRDRIDSAPYDAGTFTLLLQAAVAIEELQKELIPPVPNSVVKMSDPTYNKESIKANPVWNLAFVLSEIQNDAAPLGWSKYIFTAECLLNNFDIKQKAKS